MLVVGGGPAGAALARRLAHLGHAVVVAERCAFPRPHVGESLVGDVLPMLEVLGVRTAIEEAGFLRPESAIVRWAAAAERRPIAGEPGFQVDRGAFDHLLLAAAAQAGATVLQPARAISTERAGDGRWHTRVRWNDAEVVVESGFLADATGRRGVLGGAKRRVSPKTVALFAYWRQTPFDGPETRVDAGDDAWYWGAPLPGGEFNAAVFVDASDYRQGLTRAGGREAFYDALIARSELLRACRRGRRIGPLHACDATSRCDDAPVTADAIKVGEAAFSIDPLSSQGVQAALGSALHASAVIHTIVNRPDDAPLALRFYRARQRESVELHRRAAARFYADAASTKPGAFWRARAAAATLESHPEPREEPRLPEARTEIELAAGVRLDVVPTVREGFIEATEAVVRPGALPPIAFLDGMAVGPLVRMIEPGTTVERVLQLWSGRMPYRRAVAILRALWDAGVVCRAAARYC